MTREPGKPVTDKAKQGRPSIASHSIDADCWATAIVAATSGLICLPFISLVYWLGDEGILLHGAARMLRGETLYRDFFEFYPPGGFVIVETWLRVFGESFRSARILAILCVMAIAGVTYRTCRMVGGSPALSAGLVLSWVISSQGEWTGVNHHWFTTLFSMVTASTVLGAKHVDREYALLGGLAGGVAAIVTPTQGALTILAGAFSFAGEAAGRSGLATYIAACAIAPIAALAYVIWHDTAANAFNDIIVFAATRYSNVQGVPFGWGSTRQSLLLAILFQCSAYAALLATLPRPRLRLPDKDWRTCILLWGVGLIATFPRPDVIHIAFTAPLALPLLARALAQIANRGLRILHHVIVGALLFGAAIVSISYGGAVHGAISASKINTASGYIRVVDRGDADTDGLADVLQAIEAKPSRDLFLLYPYMPFATFLTQRSDVSPVDVFVPGYTTPYQYHQACVAAMRDAAWVVRDRKWIDPRHLRKIFPKMLDPTPPEARQFDLALQRGFQLSDQFGDFELRRRTAMANENLCRPLALPSNLTASVGRP